MRGPVRQWQWLDSMFKDPAQFEINCGIIYGLMKFCHKIDFFNSGYFIAIIYQIAQLVIQ